MEQEQKRINIAKIIKIFFTAAVFVFIFAFLFRMCQSDYKAFENPFITSSFKEAYAKSEDVRTHAVNDTFSENGAVLAYSLVYIPESEYIQFTVRYNTRHVDDVIRSYPDFSHDKVSYTLTDNEGNTYIPNIIAEEKKYNYRFFKLEFTGVDFSSENLSVNMILEGLDFDGGMLIVHRSSERYLQYDFSKEELDNLR